MAVSSPRSVVTSAAAPATDRVDHSVFVGAVLNVIVPLPDAPAGALPVQPFNEYPLQDWLRTQHRIEVPVMPWPAPPKRLLRISAQLYNSLPQYELLADALAKNDLNKL